MIRKLENSPQAEVLRQSPRYEGPEGNENTRLRDSIQSAIYVTEGLS